MSRTRTLLSICFCSGMLGALCSSLVAWQSGEFGLPDMLDVRLAPALTPAWIYKNLVWGGLWGLLYFLFVGPLKSRRHWARKGLWASLFPTLFQLLVYYPYMTRYGWLGMGLGQFTAVFIFLYNLAWGFSTGVFCRLLWGRG